MAKKPSSGSKRAKRPVSESAVKGGGIMSLNKSSTTPFMKTVIILVIIAMVTLFLYGGIAGLLELFKPRAAAPAVDPIVAIQNKYDPQLQSLTNVLASDPESYTLLVASGNRRFDYAIELMGLVSATSTAALAPAVEQWTLTTDTYKKAVKVNKDAESGVQVDFAIATYYHRRHQDRDRSHQEGPDLSASLLQSRHLLRGIGRERACDRGLSEVPGAGSDGQERRPGLREGTAEDIGCSREGPDLRAHHKRRSHHYPVATAR